MSHSNWSSIPLDAWQDTCETLHLYTQVAGKVKLALSPFLNEWWHVALSVWARGITTGPIPYDARIFEIRFDFVSHKLEILDSEGNAREIPLEPRSVAEFYRMIIDRLHAMKIDVTINPSPQEMDVTTSLDSDTVHRSYDREAVERFWNVLSCISRAFEKFRSGFSGKASPVQFWWGSFDLNLTRFPGRQCAPPPKAGRLARIDCDEEHFAAGFWAGDARLPQAAFYAYSYPAISGIERASILPKSAYWNDKLGEFILHYEDVRNSANPESEILEFLKSTYETVANAGKWDRAFLERHVE